MLDEFYGGKAHRIFTYVLAGGRNPVENFIEGLTDRDRSKMVALIASAADHGPPLHNKERCKPVEGYRFYEFKTHGQRIFWCWGPEKSIVLFHGFTKRQDKTPPSELNTGSARYAEVAEEIKKRQ